MAWPVWWATLDERDEYTMPWKHTRFARAQLGSFSLFLVPFWTCTEPSKQGPLFQLVTLFFSIFPLIGIYCQNFTFE